MSAVPEIAVVIPVWDEYVRWLPRAVASLGEQGVAVRVVVVDNASRVPVPFIAGATTLRMRSRVSVGVARNAGLAAVSAPLVCFLDADDELLPGTLARLRDRLAVRPSSVVAVPRSLAVAEGGGEAFAWDWPRPLAYRLCRHRRLFALVSALRNAYPTTGVLMRADALRAAGGFADADHEEDWLPAVALAARGHVDLDAWPGRRCRVSERSLYGAGADLATVRANRRALRRALRRDPRTRVLAMTFGWALAAAHLVSARVKATPSRRGYARLISAAGAARHAGDGARQDRQVAAQ
jgi:glycosyltransferase involved in cell wall biosynthesis